MAVGFSGDEDGLSVLRLRKWAPSEFPYNPSNFSEGFISPTRKFLLLLSYNLEALLLPLVKEKDTDCKDAESTSDGTYPNVSENDHHSSFDSKGSVSSPESVVLNSDIDCIAGVNFSGSGGAFISDVNSVAWGLCGNQYEEDSLRDVLFVSGRHGVLVHVLPRYYSFRFSKEKSAQECNAGKGTWVEWGPSTLLSSSVEVQAEAVEDDLSSGSTPKRWQTFFTTAETIKSGNDVCTRFPTFTDNMVLSFRIFDQDSKILDFLSSSSPTEIDKRNSSVSVLDPPSLKQMLIQASLLQEDDRLSNTTVGEMMKMVSKMEENTIKL